MKNNSKSNKSKFWLIIKDKKKGELNQSKTFFFKYWKIIKIMIFHKNLIKSKTKNKRIEQINSSKFNNSHLLLNMKMNLVLKKKVSIFSWLILLRV
jgi:hypothetical protein